MNIMYMTFLNIMILIGSNYIDHLLDGRDKVSQRLITSLHRRI